MKSCIIIPARLASSRLPQKILADINGKPMIVRVFEACKKCKDIDVFVAVDDPEVQKIIENVGGKAFLTDPALPSGTDRIFSALKQITNANYEFIVNVQGDVPNISSEVIMETLNLLKTNKEADIATPVVKIADEKLAEKPNIVKAILSLKGENYGKALYFTRLKAPFGEGDFFEHIGLYAYTKKALEKFISLKPSPLELRERLEQLRAIENDMNIFAGITNFHPISVDIEEDLQFAREKIKF
jgi:3-deoxy-manno-octulosonate cytidylyltransferase (CMP-KDO synthetase)